MMMIIQHALFGEPYGRVPCLLFLPIHMFGVFFARFFSIHSLYCGKKSTFWHSVIFFGPLVSDIFRITGLVSF